MRNYEIITDSGCDISAGLLNEWEVKSVSLTFSFPDSRSPLTTMDMDIKEFYAKMRNGECAKTASATILSFQKSFLSALTAGSDILYVGMSSGISTTADTGRLVAEELSKEWPERKIVVVDSLCASAGLGLAVYLAVQKKRAGASLEECAEYVRCEIANICHWFTVDKLAYLKRGGRISAATALIGAALQIKPVLHVDDEGHLVSVSKTHGRKQSIKALCAKFGELAADPAHCVYFISHGDCLDDALALQSQIEAAWGNRALVITEISPVIGAHSGPGTLALFFVGKTR